jgi:hypothetical protein
VNLVKVDRQWSVKNVPKTITLRKWVLCNF